MVRLEPNENNIQWAARSISSIYIAPALFMTLDTEMKDELEGNLNAWELHHDASCYYMTPILKRHSDTKRRCSHMLLHSASPAVLRSTQKRFDRANMPTESIQSSYAVHKPCSD